MSDLTKILEDLKVQKSSASEAAQESRTKLATGCNTFASFLTGLMENPEKALTYPSPTAFADNAGKLDKVLADWRLALRTVESITSAIAPLQILVGGEENSAPSKAQTGSKQETNGQVAEEVSAVPEEALRDNEPLEDPVLTEVEVTPVAEVLEVVVSPEPETNLDDLLEPASAPKAAPSTSRGGRAKTEPTVAIIEDIEDLLK